MSFSSVVHLDLRYVETACKRRARWPSLPPVTGRDKCSFRVGSQNLADGWRGTDGYGLKSTTAHPVGFPATGSVLELPRLLPITAGLERQAIDLHPESCRDYQILPSARRKGVSIDCQLKLPLRREHEKKASNKMVTFGVSFVLTSSVFPGVRPDFQQLKGSLLDQLQSRD